MFGNIKGRIHSVQEGLSASLRGLSVNKTGQRSRHKSESCDFNAGADILHKYQTHWSEMHEMAEENAKKADEVDSLIGELHKTFDTQWSQIAQLSSCLAALPQVLCTIHDVMEDLGMVQGLVEDVETAMLDLEDTIETQVFQERQLEHRFQLALHKEKRLSEIEQLKEQLAAQHSIKLREYEIRQQHVLRERQQTFKDAFKEDVKQYKIHGKIEKLDVFPTEDVSLDDVTLDQDTTALDEFLQDKSGTCSSDNVISESDFESSQEIVKI